MENSDFQNDLDLRRPLGLTLPGGLYLFFFLLLGHNTFEVVNTLTNLLAISATDLLKAVGRSADTSGLFAVNISVVIAVITLSGFIFRQRDYFTDRSK